MDETLWLQRLRKAAYKAAWSTWGAVAPRAHLELLHRREVEGEPRQDEFVKCCRGPAYLEPTCGYLISRDGLLIEEVLVPNFRPKKPAWRVALPSPAAFLRARVAGGARIMRIPRVVSLRHLWDWNYYHFHLDVLGKTRLLDDVGLDPRMPMVLGDYVDALPFPRQILGMGRLAQRNWIVPRGRFILADEVYYCRSRQRYKDKVDHLLDLMEVPQPCDTGGDRIFLTRPESSRGSAVNMHEVVPILDGFGFRVVDTSNMPVREQVGIFSRTRHLIAVHGAGMTNMIYRRDGPLGVLEIHPEDHVSADFLNMCRERKHKLHRLRCPSRPGPARHHFAIDPKALRTEIRLLLRDG